jgi:hypothetical protein
MKMSLYIAVKPTQTATDVPKVEELANPASNWGIVAAIIIAAMPHLWQWLGGHQKARNNLTETLLQKLSDSYQNSSASNEMFRKIIEDAVEKPAETAEQNAQRLRDIQDDLAEMRGKVLEISKKLDYMATIITRQAQTK